MKPATDVTTEEAVALIDQGQILVATTAGSTTPKKLAALMLPDGALYFGDWQDGKRSGKGE